MPHDEYDIRGIAHAHTNRKGDILMQRGVLQTFKLSGDKELVHCRSLQGDVHIPLSGIFVVVIVDLRNLSLNVGKIENGRQVVQRWAGLSNFGKMSILIRAGKRKLIMTETSSARSATLKDTS